MVIKFFDTHCHYNVDPLFRNVHAHFEQLQKEGYFVVVVGTNMNDSMDALKIAKAYSNCVATIGIHPSEANDYNDQDIALMEKTLNENSNYIKAIGECGLDYHYPDYDKQKQIDLFCKQIELAIKYKTTLVLHIRDAHDDAIEILSQYNFSGVNVIVHCYTDNVTHAKWYIEQGFFISIPGVITFKNPGELLEVAKMIPYDQLLTETDAPYLSPVPKRGQVNESLNIQYTNTFLANHLGIDFEEFNHKLIKNAFFAFNIKKNI